MDEKLDLYPYVAAAIAINPKSWHIIDNKIIKHIDVLYEFGIKSDYWDKPPIVSLPARSVVYARKLLCAFEYIKAYNENADKEHEDVILSDIYDMLYDLFKKAFPEIYQRVMSGQNVSIKKVMKSLLEKKKNDFSWEEIILYEKNLFLTVFCANLFDKKIAIDEGYKFFIDYLKARLDYDKKNECETGFAALGNIKKMDFAAIEGFRKEGKRLQEKIETNNPFFYKMHFLGQEVQDALSQKTAPVHGDSYFHKLNSTSAHETINAVYPKINTVLSHIFDMFDIDVPELQYANLDFHEIERIYAFAYLEYRQLFDSLREEEKLSKIQDIIVVLVYLWPLLKDYVQLKRQYAVLHDEYIKKFVIQKREEKNLEALEEEIKKLKLYEIRYHELKEQFSDYDSIKKQLDHYKTMCEKQLSENEQLKKENNLLKHEIEKYKADMEELAKLRNIIFEEEIEQHLPVEDDYSILKDKKIAVIGGHKGQYDELKNYAQVVIHIEAGRLNYDENVLANADVVVFISKILTHTGYYKAINAVKKLNLKYIITSYTNLDKLLQMLADFFRG